MYRIGIGLDVHRFAKGRKLMLGCVKIPYDKGLSGHSDADVLVHSVVDAILGAMGKRDIGQLYSPEDNKWKDYPGKSFLRDMRDLLRSNGWEIVNIDSVIIAQEPRMATFIPDMKDKIAQYLGILPDVVVVKATTSEGLGFTGRVEGIAAQAVVLLKKKNVQSMVDEAYV